MDYPSEFLCIILENIQVNYGKFLRNSMDNSLAISGGESRKTSSQQMSGLTGFNIVNLTRCS